MSGIIIALSLLCLALAVVAFGAFRQLRGPRKTPRVPAYESQW
jgi:hypothetical protein